MASLHQGLRGKKVFVTGHSGFTGSWACIWLNLIGADVYGYSLEPDTTPNLFTEASVKDLVDGEFGDVRDFETLRESIQRFQPDVILHLAAQPLVRRSFRIPRETFDVNAQGTANILESARLTPSVKAILCITTDKVYKNLELEHDYVENDELGGKDPYSASKAAAEVIISGYRDTLRGQGVEFPIISVARGGNIVGGGDWSRDRLIPDFIRAHESGEPLPLRFPNSTRPWQHVLSLIDGYLGIITQALGPKCAQVDQAFNLGPVGEAPVSVSGVLDLLSLHIPGVLVKSSNADLPEAGMLGINSSLAVGVLGWNPRWGTQQVIEQTASWYKNFLAGNGTAYNLCLDDIKLWESTGSGF
jgi:CDP-glucose 4,6-dehydratase